MCSFQRPQPSLLGWSPKRPYLIYIALSLVLSGLSLAIGLFWPDLMPTREGLSSALRAR
jgi:hypothetical protein